MECDELALTIVVSSALINGSREHYLYQAFYHPRMLDGRQLSYTIFRTVDADGTNLAAHVQQVRAGPGCGAGIGFEHGDRAVRDCGEAERRGIPGYFVDGGPRVQVSRVTISGTVAATRAKSPGSKAIRYRSLPSQSEPSFPRPLFAM